MPATVSLAGRVWRPKGWDRLETQEPGGSVPPQGSLSFALKDFQPQMKPTQAVQSNLLYLKSADVEVNLTTSTKYLLLNT